MIYRKQSKGSGGFTLVEVIVSIALLAIVTIMVVAIMGTALRIIKNTRERTSDTMTAANQVESKRADSQRGDTTGAFTVTFGGTNYTVSGSYIAGQDGGVTYHEFVPD